MAENIWEESDYNITATVVDKTKPYSGKVDILYLKNNDKANPLKKETDQTLKGGKLKRTYKVPKVGPKEATYALSIVVKYGDSKEKTQQVADAVVWPKVVEIHAKEIKDGKPVDLKQGKLKVMQGGKETAKPLTDAKGKCTVRLSQKAPYKIEGRDSYVIVKNEEDPNKKRFHELTVERRIRARFVSPDITKSPPWEANAATNTLENRKNGVRQFVNLKSKKGGADALGNEVLFEVSADPAEDGRKDDKIFIQVTFSKGSKRNDPKTELLNNPAVSDLALSGSKRVYTGYVKLAKDGGTAKFKVNLGLAGGDYCKIRVSGRKDEFKQGSITMVNWRKLWYELRFPTLLKTKLSARQDYPDGLRTAFSAHLAKAYIVFEKYKSHEFADSKATVAKKGGMIVPAAYFKDATGGNRYMVANGILNTNNKFSGDAGLKSRSIYVSLCERAFTSNTKNHTMSPVIKSADFDVASPADYLFEPSTKDGTHNLKVQGGYKWKASVTGAHNQATKLVFDPATPSTGGASAGRVRIVETRRTGQAVDISFAAKAGGKFETALAAGEKTKVENFVAGLLNSAPDLRDCGNQVTLRLVCLNAGADDLARFTAVRNAAQSKFTAVGKSIKYHPGLDRNGNPREGDMKVEWLSFKDYETIRVRLPQSPVGTADYRKALPGDFAGDPESDTKCNVKVKFDCVTAYEINGNSGGGEQIMVLRANATADAIAETVCHELGHSMGMTIVPGLENDLVPPGLTAKHVDNGKSSYVDGNPPYNFNDGKRSIHRGGHCAKGLPNAKKNFKDFDGWGPTSASKGCIMWGSGDNVQTRDGYCDNCLELIKGRRLDDIRKEWAGRGANDG